MFGAFNAMKNRDGADKHRNAFLTWVAYVGGPRESRRLYGDVLLTEEDIVAKKDFPDGCVPSTWSIDLHYPKEQYAKKYPDNPFISKAVHGKGVDRSYGYPVPYRCFYSRNIENLFMAGRCISVTHEALGTVRVMKTCGMMGEVVGRAASICVKRDCLPRDVYTSYLDDLIELIQPRISDGSPQLVRARGLRELRYFQLIRKILLEKTDKSTITCTLATNPSDPNPVNVEISMSADRPIYGDDRADSLG